MMAVAAFACWMSSSMSVSAQAAPEVPVFNAERGFWQIWCDSDYQNGAVRVEVLLPASMEKGKKYPVVYVLPVIGDEGVGNPKYGDGLIEAKKAGVADRYGVICIRPSFTEVPWYGNHATDPKVRQEDYILKDLIPAVEKNWPVRSDAEGRWLVGFSKSGWGAYTLLLRNPEVFGYAAAWDAPFMLDGENSGKNWGPMGISKVMGTKETMQQFLPARLVVAKADFLKQRKRLVLGAGIDWKGQSVAMHALLEKEGIPHACRPDLLLKHRWDSGWFGPMTEELVDVAAGSMR
jgi:enterochelin esterase-like enzyme